MSEKKKRNIIICSLCGVLLLMVVGYAAFSTLLNIEGTSSISSNWDIRITSITESAKVGDASAIDPTFEDLITTFKVNLINPNDSITYDVKVENKGTINAILEKIDITKTVNKAINVTYEGITAGDKLEVGASAILTVKIEYNPEVTSQPTTTESLFNMNLNYVEEGKSNIPETNISKILNVGGENVPIVKTDDGLYEDTYEPGRYIYKGADPDNYITFNGEDAGWRIVSIETDDTIKIVKSQALPSQPFDTEGLRTTEYCARAVLNGAWKGCNIWATTSEFDNNSTLPNGVKGKVITDSSLKTYLNGTYYNNLTANKKAIQKHNFYYGSATFNNPDLASQIISEKKYFASSNVGLIQASDYIKANTDITNCGTFKLVRSNNTLCKMTNWLNPTRGCYWTITPLYVNDGGAASSAMFTILVDPVGFLGHHNAASTVINVDPVVYLKSSTKLSGNGTLEEPFKITNYIE